MANIMENNLLAAAMLETLRTSVPAEQQNELINSLFERAKNALITVDALQNEVVRLIAENQRLSARVAKLEAQEKE